MVHNFINCRSMYLNFTLLSSLGVVPQCDIQRLHRPYLVYALILSSNADLIFPSYSIYILNFPYFMVGCFQVLFDFLCNYKLDVYCNSFLYIFTGIPFCISRNLIWFYLLTDYVGIYQVNRTFCVVYHFLWKNKWSYSSKLGDYCFLTYLWPCRFHFLFR